jgi:integrase
MKLWWIGMAVAARPPTTRPALGQGARQDEADSGDGALEALGFGTALGTLWHLFRFALGIPQWLHGIKYIGVMTEAMVAETITRFTPRASSQVVAFAKETTRVADPHSCARAKALLFALTKLGTYAVSVGTELDPARCLTPSMIERFIIEEGKTMTQPTRRTLRSNLRFVAARVLVHQSPAPIALPRERAKIPYSRIELAAYFSLAAHQPTEARCHRALGLLCLGAGAGLTGADLRCVKGTDVVQRSGGLLVEVTGTRPRVVPVLERYWDLLMASADFAGSHYVVGGNDPYRHNVTTPLISSLSGGSDLGRLEVSRLRSTWLVDVAEAIGLKAFLCAAGITCTQRLGDLVANIEAPSEAESVVMLGHMC